MKQKLTPWFPGHVKPVRKGVYLRDWTPKDDSPGYAYWNGQYWGVTFTDGQHGIRLANLFKNGTGSYQNELQWRGIAK